MTDIKQIYTSHQSLVGTVTPEVIRTVPFSRGGVVLYTSAMPNLTLFRLLPTNENEIS